METAKEIARDLGLSLRTVVRTYTLAKERWPEFQLNEADAQAATGEGKRFAQKETPGSQQHEG